LVRKTLIMIESDKQKNKRVALAKIIEAGLQIEPKFNLSTEQEEYYLDLFAYFMGAPRRFDVSKGLLILGTVGTGKTLSMQVMRKIFNGFRIAETRYIIRDFFASNPNTVIIDLYGRESFGKTPAGIIDYKKPINYCFDDFGLESVNVKVYGNVANVMEEIIHDRYQNFLKHKMMTHATSNLDIAQLQECYGERTRDRLRQMMNVVTLTGESLRK